MPVIPAIGRLRQEDHQFIVGYIVSWRPLDYLMRSCLKTKKSRNENKEKRSPIYQESDMLHSLGYSNTLMLLPGALLRPPCDPSRKIACGEGCHSSTVDFKR
jgi:hypothetical protein